MILDLRERSFPRFPPQSRYDGPMRKTILWLMLGSGTLPSACSITEQFACGADDQCSIGEIAGRCEPGGVCSFPDSDCPSGHRYGELSGELAGECVDADGGTSPATEDGTTSDTPQQTEGADGSSADPSSTTSTSTSTSTSTGTSTSPSTSTTTTSDGSSSSGLEPDPDPYGPCVEDNQCPVPDSQCLAEQGFNVCVPPCDQDPCPSNDQTNGLPLCVPVIPGFDGCVLLCEANECPMGMQCEPIGPEGFGMCVWP